MRLSLLAFLLGLCPLTFAQGLEEFSQHRDTIESNTNLKYQSYLDSSFDSFGENHWTCSGLSCMSYTVMTVDYWSKSDGIPLNVFANQAQSGRTKNLGPIQYWKQAPSPHVPLSRSVQLSDDPDANWIILTDMEPDDRLALAVLSRTLPKEKVLAVGTTLLHSGRKARLARRLLDQLGWNQVPVYQGNGGDASSYPEIASNAAARSYRNEGMQILSGPARAEAAAMGSSSMDLQAFIQEALKRANRTRRKINFLVLSPVTDLANALLISSSPQYNRTSAADHQAINRVVMTGGWVESKKEDGSSELRSTYNWNMDPMSAFVALNNLNVTLISSHMIKPSFGGGSINSSNAPGVARLLESGRHSALRDFRLAGRSWDEHLIQTIPPLASIVGPYKGNQFTPADVVAALYVTDPTIATSTQQNMRVELNLNDVTSKGHLINLKPAEHYQKSTSIVQAVDGDRFIQKVEAALGGLKSPCDSLLLASRR